MADEMAAAGLGLSFEYGGKTYELTPPTVDLIPRLVQWAKNNAFKQVEELQHLCSPEQYAARMANVAELVVSGAFSANSPNFQRAVNSFEGMTYQLYLRLHKKHPEVTPDLAEKMLFERAAEIMAKMSVTSSGSPSPNEATPTTA